MASAGLALFFIPNVIEISRLALKKTRCVHLSQDQPSHLWWGHCYGLNLTCPPQAPVVNSCCSGSGQLFGEAVEPLGSSGWVTEVCPQRWAFKCDSWSLAPDLAPLPLPPGLLQCE